MIDGAVDRPQHPVRRALGFLWPDEAVTFALLGRAVSFISAPITLLLVATHFSPIYQGFYYTFTTITSLTTLLELGLGMVLTQFASHEFAHLHWTGRDHTLSGEDGPQRHLLGILVKACRWYLLVAVAAFVLFTPAGLAFFHAQGQTYGVTYVVPWIVLVALTALGLVAIPLVSVIEGCDRVVDMTRLRLIQAATSALLLWFGIATGQALFAAALAAAGPVIVPAIWLGRRYPGLIRQIWRAASDHLDAAISWRDELLPMQWRIAVSWFAGFLTFSLFNPLLFRYQGAAVAGQMGMSLTLANAPFAVGMSWIATRVPRYGTLIRRRDYPELDRLARTGTLQAIVVWALGSGALLLAVAFLPRFAPNFAHRILGVPAVAALCAAALVNVVMQAMASYLRAHKQEPYVGLSVGTGVVVAAGLFVAARYGSALAMAVTYAAIVLVFELPAATVIFIRKRRAWHSNA